MTLEHFCRRFVIPIWVFNAVAWTWLLGGCDPARDFPMERKTKVEASIITWVDAKPGACGDAQGNILGCAESSAGGAICKVTMPADSPDWIIAHEFKHCFGWTHGVLK